MTTRHTELSESIQEAMGLAFAGFKDEFLVTEGDPDKKVMVSCLDKFRRQIGAVPKAHGMKNTVSQLSHEGIKAFWEGDYKEYKKCYEQSLQSMCDLSGLDIAPSQASLHAMLRAQAGRELAELAMTPLFYNFVMNGEPMTAWPDPYELYITPQSLIDGVFEAVGETSRLTDSVTLEQDMGLDQQVVIKTRLRILVHEVRITLFKMFGGTPDNVINNVNGKNFRAGFKGRLDGLKGLENFLTQKIVELRGALRLHEATVRLEQVLTGATSRLVEI